MSGGSGKGGGGSGKGGRAARRHGETEIQKETSPRWRQGGQRQGRQWKGCTGDLTKAIATETEIQKKTSPRRQKRTRSLVQAAAGARHGYGRRQRQGRQGRTGDLETEIQKKTSPRKQKIIRSLVEAIAYRPRGLKKTEAGSPCWSATGGG